MNRSADSDESELFPCDFREALMRLRSDRLVRRHIHCSDARLDCEIVCDTALSESAHDGSARPSDRFTQPLATLVHPAEPTVRLRVAVTRLPREVNPSDCTAILCDAAGESIVQSRTFSSPVGRLPDYLSNTSEQGRETYVRRTAIKDADRLFVVETSASADEYRSFADSFLVSLASFRLERPEQRYTAEPLVVVELPRVGARFALPSSWRRCAERGFERAPGILFEDAIMRENQGAILVSVASASQLGSEELLAKYLKHLEFRGLCGESGGFAQTAVLNDGFDSSAGFVATMLADAHQVEVRMAVLSHPRTNVLVGLTGPTRRDAGGFWAINKRAFELVVSSMQVKWV